MLHSVQVRVGEEQIWKDVSPFLLWLLFSYNYPLPTACFCKCWVTMSPDNEKAAWGKGIFTWKNDQRGKVKWFFLQPPLSQLAYQRVMTHSQKFKNGIILYLLHYRQNIPFVSWKKMKISKFMKCLRSEALLVTCLKSFCFSPVWRKIFKNMNIFRSEWIYI